MQAATCACGESTRMRPRASATRWDRRRWSPPAMRCVAARLRVHPRPPSPRSRLGLDGSFSPLKAGATRCQPWAPRGLRTTDCSPHPPLPPNTSGWPSLVRMGPPLPRTHALRARRLGAASPLTLPLTLPAFPRPLPARHFLPASATGTRPSRLPFPVSRLLLPACRLPLAACRFPISESRQPNAQPVCRSPSAIAVSAPRAPASENSAPACRIRRAIRLCAPWSSGRTSADTVRAARQVLRAAASTPDHGQATVRLLA